MLNYIWAGMILLGVIYGVCTGQMSALTGGALDSARADSYTHLTLPTTCDV